MGTILYISIIIILLIALCFLYHIYQKALIIQKDSNDKYDKEIKQKKQELNNLEDELKDIENKKLDSLNAYNLAIRQRLSVEEEIERKKHSAIADFQTQVETLNNQFNKYKEQVQEATSAYSDVIESNYSEIEKKYEIRRAALDKSLTETQKELDNLSSAFEAGVAAQLREREKEEKLDFYKLPLSKNNEQDIFLLEKIKVQLNNPVILSKLIWTSYFQKATTDLCNRILGPNTRCGIYRITNLKNQQCYIGQSVDVATRWKNHIKTGLGIDASSTNKLYSAMQEYGVWNFSFELIEDCSKEQLNEKEAFWINMYKSDQIGMNSTKGNK